MISIIVPILDIISLIIVIYGVGQVTYKQLSNFTRYVHKILIK